MWNDVTMMRRALCLATAALFAACAAKPGTTTMPTTPTTTPTTPNSAAAAELASTGKLRAAINFGNPILASRGADGQPRGVSVDLAREAARRLGVPIELVQFTSAG